MRFAGLRTIAAIVSFVLADQVVAVARQSGPPAVNLVCPQFIVAKSLVYPRPGAVNVAPGVGTVIISGIDVKGTVTLRGNSGPPIVTEAIAPLPIPMPSPVGPAVSSALTAYTLPVLRRHTTYMVFAQENPLRSMPKRCPNNVPLQLGPFTTGR